MMEKLRAHVGEQRNELVSTDKLKRYIDKLLDELNDCCGMAEAIQGRVDVKEYIDKYVKPIEWIRRMLWCHYYTLKNIAEGKEKLNEDPLLDAGDA